MRSGVIPNVAVIQAVQVVPAHFYTAIFGDEGKAVFDSAIPGSRRKVQATRSTTRHVERYKTVISHGIRLMDVYQPGFGRPDAAKQVIQQVDIIGDVRMQRIVGTFAVAKPASGSIILSVTLPVTGNLYAFDLTQYPGSDDIFQLVQSR